MPKHVWNAMMEHLIVGSMSAFNKKIRETRSQTLSKRKTVEARHTYLIECIVRAGRFSIKSLVDTRALEQRIGSQ